MEAFETLAAKLVAEYRNAADQTGGYDPDDPEGLRIFTVDGWREHAAECKRAGVDPDEVLTEAMDRVRIVRLTWTT